MHNPHISPRKKQLMLLLGYAIMTMVVFVISIVCILLIMGYRFNFDSRSLEQGGLIQFRSVPAGATITVDEQRLSFTTPGKQNLPAGAHTVQFDREGYLPWRKSFMLDAGELRWLNYARLIPNEIATTTAQEYKGFKNALPSPDRQYIAVVDEAELAITVVDIRDDEQIVSRLIQLDEELFNEKITGIELISWSNDSRYMIISGKSGDENEFIRIDRTVKDGDGINISRVAGLKLIDVDFERESNSVLLARIGQTIRRINLSQETMSSPLATDITDYFVSEEADIAYATKQDAQTIINVYIDDTRVPVRNIDDEPDVHVAIGTYYDDRYLAVAHGPLLEIIKSPETQDDSAGRNFAELELPFIAKDVSISQNGRFVVAERGLQFFVYDFETDEQYTFRLDGSPANNQEYNLEWLDGYYFYTTQDDAVVITEFDGTNRHRITSALAGTPVTLSRDGTYLYSFNSLGDNQVGLVRSQLILE